VMSAGHFEDVSGIGAGAEANAGTAVAITPSPVTREATATAIPARNHTLSRNPGGDWDPGRLGLYLFENMTACAFKLARRIQNGEQGLSPDARLW
jgi:hypothetical protein